MALVDPSDDVRESDVAIVGMACRFPGAEDTERFWRNLRDGTRTTTFFTVEELLAAGVSPRDLADPQYVKAGQVLPGIDRFDAGLFRIPRDEAEILDPQQRIFLECALTALEDAGCDPDRHAGPIGVYAGVGLNAYALHRLAQRYRDASEVERYRLMIAVDKDFLATRVSYKLGLRGPSVNVGTACSTSLVAVHLACLALLGGECDAALAGSAHIRFPQDQGYLHQPGMIFSPDGHCRAFDSKAQGTVIGSGVGVVLLKRLADALSAGDRVHAVIKGSAINNDGAVKASYTAPSIQGQASVIADALAVAQCPPETIGYVEAHGTGTALGDPVEVAALNEAFAAAGPAHSCALGSVKSNVGHLDTAAGMAGLIKTSLMLRHAKLVPTLDFEAPNPDIPFADGPFRVATELCDWPAPDGSPRRAGVSAFGIGGTNAHVVLEEAPPSARRPEDLPTGPELLLISAATPAAADRATADLSRHLRRHPDTPLRDAAATLALGRRAHPHRRFVVAKDTRDAAMALAVADPARVPSAEAALSAPGAAFLCTGEPVPEAADFYGRSPAFRAAVDECLAAAGADADAVAALSAGDALSAALAEYATAQLLRAWGIQPAAVLATAPAGWRAAGCLAGAFPPATMLHPTATCPPSPGALPLWVAGAWAGAEAAPGSQGGGAAEGTGGGTHAGAGAAEAALEGTGWTPLVLAPGTGALLTALGRAWLAGVAVDWAAFYAERPFRRTSLPTYPFQRERFWYDPAPDPAATDPERMPLRAQLAGRPVVVQVSLLTEYLRDEIGRALGPQPTEDGLPDPAAELFDLNAESLMLIELTAKLSDELSYPVPATGFIDYPTIDAFVENLFEEMHAAGTVLE
ncbi:type I polyketide synthase [Actinacidiphila paucisporea]|uniref:Phosphopantetheine attachment site n=1 Tax=Actinacidiphila paucisporea TaxID=310782 RepID=A0A1M7PMN1_9ACTN|nr:beta-ketoacyl synthase N-terminal-like domain-containing protein [Actinacidiphila paucisporea]SHN18539.1 Phosphopantetheine attachment site [Actinacidiphila paucisporea]